MVGKPEAIQAAPARLSSQLA